MMLARRAAAQVSRSRGFTRMHRKPRGYLRKEWDPTGEWSPVTIHAWPWWKNRRTDEPHKHERQKARNLRRQS